MDRDYDLEGWTEIAAALGCHERTAQRYSDRKNDPLVVYCGLGKVVAIKAEVLAWKRRQMVALPEAGRGRGRRAA